MTVTFNKWKIEMKMLIVFILFSRALESQFKCITSILIIIIISIISIIIIIWFHHDQEKYGQILIYKTLFLKLSLFIIRGFLFCLYQYPAPCSDDTFKSSWNQFWSFWSSCERNQKVSNWFQTDWTKPVPK